MLSHARIDPEHLLLAAARLGNVEHLLAGHPATRRSRSAWSTGKPCLQALPSGAARRRHRDGVRVRRRRRPDHAHLGRTQPRQALVLHSALTRTYLPSGPLPVADARRPPPAQNTLSAPVAGYLILTHAARKRRLRMRPLPGFVEFCGSGERASARQAPPFPWGDSAGR
jgi:hypothetical protein